MPGTRNENLEVYIREEHMSSATEKMQQKVNEEKEVLLRFKDGKKVEEGELEILQRYSSIGLVHIGISFTKKEIQAKITKSGKGLLGISE